MDTKLLLLIVTAVIVMWLLMDGKYSEYFGSAHDNTADNNLLRECELVKRDLDACRANSFLLMTRTIAIEEELKKEREKQNNNASADTVDSETDDTVDGTPNDTEGIPQWVSQLMPPQ